jgi:predicted dehydrogenase
MSARGRLQAVASRNHEKAEAYAKEWQIPDVFSSYQEMLESDLIDAVYISTPHHLHAEWTIKALQAGKHVLCEKPFALSLDEVDAMIAAQKESGKVLAEAFMYRHHPQTKMIGEWINSGRLGEVHMMSAVFNFMLQEKHNTRLVPEYGGGALWDIGVYPVSLGQYVFGGKPRAVTGMQGMGSTGVDTYFTGQMDYGGNRFAQISASFSLPFEMHAEIIGTKGKLLIPRPFARMDEENRIIFIEEEKAPVDIPVPEEYLYLGEIEDMHDAILKGKASYLTLQESRSHVETILALYESATSQKLVRLT